MKENSAYISVIAVLKKYQKCGIGISLINRVINYFKNQDLEIYLDVESKNKTAINWYNKRGFIQIIESTTLCTNKRHGEKNENKRY
nr:GNAT family N-acetyltransferase [Treponema denticola]